MCRTMCNTTFTVILYDANEITYYQFTTLQLLERTRLLDRNLSDNECSVPRTGRQNCCGRQVCKTPQSLINYYDNFDACVCVYRTAVAASDKGLTGLETDR